MTQPRGFSSHEEAMAALLAHLAEPIPVGHGLHDDSITDEPIRFHQWLHKFGDKIAHEHKRPEDDE